MLHNIWSLTALAQQYIIDASFRIDREVADFIRKTQLDRRMVLPAEVKRAIKSGLRPGEELGKIVLANSHVIGSFQWCQTMYQVEDFGVWTYNFSDVLGCYCNWAPLQESQISHHINIQSKMG